MSIPAQGAVGAETMTGTLWCMHISGPDDVHAAPDFWTALSWASELNAAVAARAIKQGWAGDDNWPLAQATVQRWPWSAERHADSLATELAARVGQDTALASPRADSDERTAGEVLSPEAVLAALDRFTLQVLSRDVEPREDDTWAVIDTKTADPMTNWPGELAGEYPTHAEARVGLMKAALAVAAGQDRVACRKLCPSCQGSRGGMIGESGGSPDWDNCWTCNGEGFAPAQPAGAVPDSLRALSEAATKGEWYTKSEKCDGSYGSGEDCGEGYLAYSILTDAEPRYGNPGVIAETSNSTVGVIHEESGEDGFTAWDETARANTAFIVAAVNHVRSLLASHPAGQSAGSGAEDAEQRITNLANALESARRQRGEQERRAINAEQRLIELEQGKIHPALAVDVQEHRNQAYQTGWDDGYAEGHGKATADAQRPAPDSTRTGQGEDWRDDPSADDRWCAGLDYAQRQWCDVLGVDPDTVCWDAATETLDGDIQAVICGILAAWGGDDWQDKAARPAAPEAQGAEECAVDLLREVLPILKLPKDDPNAYAGGTIGRIQALLAGLDQQEDLDSRIATKCREVDAVLGPDPWKTRKHVGGIYIASKTAHAPRWRQMRADGLPIISTWIDEAGKGETACFTDLWRRCVDEAASADAVIVYRQPDEVLKGAFVEVGAALAVGTPVYAIGCDEFSFVHHTGVTRCADLQQALDLAAPPASSGQGGR